MTDHEKLSDPSDRATATEMDALDDALGAIRRRAIRSQEADQGGAYAVLDCIECGNEIGRGRLDAAIKNTICIDCAVAAEKRSR